MHLLEAPTPRTEHTYVLSAEAPLMVLCSHPLEVSQEQGGDQHGVRTTGSALLLSGRKWHMSKTRWRTETPQQGCAPRAPVPALSPSWALPDRLMSQATMDSPLLWGWLYPQALLVVLGEVKGAWPPPSSQQMLSRNFSHAMAHALKGQFSFNDPWEVGT